MSKIESAGASSAQVQLQATTEVASKPIAPAAERVEVVAAEPTKAHAKTLGTDRPVRADLQQRPGQATRVQAAALSGDPTVTNKRLRDAIVEFGKAKALRETLVATQGARTEANTLEPYNGLAMHLSNASNAAGLLGAVHPDKAVREAAEKLEQEISDFATGLTLDRDLYDAFAKVPQDGLDAQAKRLVTKVLRDFRRSGVDKDPETRAKVRELNADIVKIGQDFDRNIREDVRSIKLDSAKDLEGLPADYIAAHQPGPDGKITITTDYPDYIPFMTYAKNGQARHDLAFAYKNRGYPVNEQKLKELISTRNELATTLGYPTWAAYVTEDKMIKSPQNAADFIEKVAAIAEPRAKSEYQELLDEKRKDDPTATQVNPWEASYYQEKVKQAKYAFDSQSVRPYLDYNEVRDGLLNLTSELYGVRFEKAKGADVWDKSVEAYDVMGADGKMGRIYLDMHPRDGKYKHAAQFPLKPGVDGTQVPEGALVCNFPTPDPKTGIALMDHDQVTTFFHEFGHLMHHVLGGKQKWTEFSGVATEWDFVEAPSQFYEEWAWDPKVLARFARNVETKEPIPAELVAQMKRANDYGEGIQTRQQMFYAAMSLNFYNRDPKSFDVHELALELQDRYSVYPDMPGTHFESNFGHLNGYSAIYYTYMWSLVIAKDMLSAFEQKGLMDVETARHYRDAVLAKGGSADAAELVKDFLGRPYSFDAFKKWLEKGG